MKLIEFKGAHKEIISVNVDYIAYVIGRDCNTAIVMANLSKNNYIELDEDYKVVMAKINDRV